ncbi:hypothetical protein F5878DRAFT_665244 [Lentinula raphanica]|uniref:Uncharacterized protein n=1 Tax=Lentinula raphanica TaxID=153919 RepID=A0AA38P0I0_9AGAR|nr:hypothetical protein F5878DRAFT_665244 [Lentinula raphanica]
MTLLTIPRFYPSKLGLLIVFFAILLDVAFTLPTNSVHSTSSDHSVHTGSVSPQPNEAPPAPQPNEAPPAPPFQPLQRIAVYVSHLDEDGYPTYWSWVRFGGYDVPDEDLRQYRSQKFSREEAERLQRRQTIHDSPIVRWRRNWFYKVVNPSESDPTIHDAIFHTGRLCGLPQPVIVGRILREPITPRSANPRFSSQTSARLSYESQLCQSRPGGLVGQKVVCSNHARFTHYSTNAVEELMLLSARFSRLHTITLALMGASTGIIPGIPTMSIC